MDEGEEGAEKKSKRDTKRVMMGDDEEEERRGGRERMDSCIEDVVYLGRDVCHSPRDPPNDFRGYDYRLSHYARPFCQVTISLFDISGVARIIGLQTEVLNEKQACMGVMINDHGKICA